MNTCVACEEGAWFVVAVSYTEKPPEGFEYPPLVFSCDTHLGVIMSQSMIVNNTSRWAVMTYHEWMHTNGIDHPHEEADDLSKGGDAVML